MRLTLHPHGLAPKFASNGGRIWWRGYGRQVELTADQQLAALLREAAAYTVAEPFDDESMAHEVLVPFKVRAACGVLSFFSTTTVFGTPVDVKLAELAIESFFPADRQTAEKVKGWG